MKRFVVPPNWPMPPRRSWVPPKTWEPDPDWPPAPKGWKYWVNGKGKAVIGPVGRYGAPSVRAVVAGLGGAVLFVSVNLWALAAIGVFDGGSPKPQAAPATSESPSGSVTATPSTTPTASPQAGPVTPSPAQTTEPSGSPTPQTSSTPVEPTSRPTQTPTRTEQGRSPRPSTTVGTSPVPTPTSEGPFAQYCHQLGDPKWCDPASSSTPQPPGKSHRHR